MMTVSSSFSSPFYACATMRWAWRPGQLSAAAFPLSSLCVQNLIKLAEDSQRKGTLVHFRASSYRQFVPAGIRWFH